MTGHLWQSQKTGFSPLVQKWQIAVLILLCCGFVHTTQLKADLPHVVIILVDDMGYGDPRCYNPDSKIPTPHIDGLARAGMKFTDAHASGPLCHMSRYGLMTGQYPFRVNVGEWRRRPLIGSNQMTIASLLRQKGYHTHMVGKWHLGFAENGYDQPLPGGPVHVGFNSYFGIRASTDIPPYFYIRGDKAVKPPTKSITANASEGWSPIQGAFWRAGMISPDLELKDVLPRFTDEAIQVIENHAAAETKAPMMLYLAYPAPHTPWLPSPEFIGSSKASMYGDFMVMVDAMIGKVLGALDRAKMAEDTLVLFSSDNGPVWYETDVKRFDHDSSGGLRGMKADAWECGHRMPFIVRWPERVKPGTTSDQLVSFVDLLATFGEMAEVRLSDADGPDSFSFLPALLNQEPTLPERKTLALRSGKGLYMVRSGPWKLIEGRGSGGFSDGRKKGAKRNQGPTTQLYNLAEDLGETNNLFAKQPERVRELKALLTKIRESKSSRLLPQP